jgi:transposase-like protein
MPKRLHQKDLASVVDAVRQSTDGARRSEIAKALKEVPQRTLQYWLKSLVEEGRLMQEGKGPAARYRLPGVSRRSRKKRLHDKRGPEEEKPEEVRVPLSAESAKIREYLRQPIRGEKGRGV